MPPLKVVQYIYKYIFLIIKNKFTLLINENYENYPSITQVVPTYFLQIFHKIFIKFHKFRDAFITFYIYIYIYIYLSLESFFNKTESKVLDLYLSLTL